MLPAQSTELACTWVDTVIDNHSVCTLVALPGRTKNKVTPRFRHAPYNEERVHDRH